MGCCRQTEGGLIMGLDVMGAGVGAIGGDLAISQDADQPTALPAPRRSPMDCRSQVC